MSNEAILVQKSHQIYLLPSEFQLTSLFSEQIWIIVSHLTISVMLFLILLGQEKVVRETSCLMSFATL